MELRKRLGFPIFPYLYVCMTNMSVLIREVVYMQLFICVLMLRMYNIFMVDVLSEWVLY